MHTWQEVTEHVQRSVDGFSPAETRLSAHLVEHPELWGFEPTTGLAKTLNVHRSTIVRFAQRLGFSGYPQLQETVRNAYLGSVTSPVDLTLGEGAGAHGGVVRAVVERELSNLRQTYAKLDSNVLIATAERLAHARHVLVFGRRFSYAIAQSTSLTLRTLRPNVRLAPEPGGSSLDAMFDLGAEDAALVISLRRHSPPVQRALESLTEQGVPCTILTDASPIVSMPTEVQVLQAHIGSTSTLDSFTSLVSVSHTLCTLVGHLLPGAAQRWQRVEGARLNSHIE